MSEQRLQGKRVLVTQADDYMGPATIELFREHGAEVIADRTDLTQPSVAQDIVEAAGHIDVLVANLAADARFGITAVDTDDALWHTAFDVMVHPLHRLCRAVLPQMYGRREGKIVVYGSATGLAKPRPTPPPATHRSAMSGRLARRRPATTCKST